MKKRLSLTVGITTCYGGESILETVKSIRAQKDISKFRFIIIADRVRIKPLIRNRLRKFDVELIENNIEGSQIEKQRQIIDLTDSDILILTQDDVLYDQYAFFNILSAFNNDKYLTMASVRNQHLKPISFFEDILNVGTRIANNLAESWNRGNNYLSNVGRCMVFRTNYLKKYFMVPESVATTDAYYYFSNKKAGGGFRYLSEVAVYFRNPQNMTEHLRKSSRFQYSQFEMTRFFNDIKNEYNVPKAAIIKAIFSELKKYPVKTILYLFVGLYTRVKKLAARSVLNPNWEVDVSTKQI